MAVPDAVTWLGSLTIVCSFGKMKASRIVRIPFEIREVVDSCYHSKHFRLCSSISQSSRYSASKEMWYARVRGDEIAGVPIGLSDQHLQLSSPFAFNIDRRESSDRSQLPLLSSLGLTVVSKSWLSSGKASDWESSELGIFSSARSHTLYADFSCPLTESICEFDGKRQFPGRFCGKHHATENCWKGGPD